MPNHLDDLIVFNRLANYAKLDTAEGILSKTACEQLDVGDLTQGWDVWDIGDNGDEGTLHSGPAPRRPRRGRCRQRYPAR